MTITKKDLIKDFLETFAVFISTIIGCCIFNAEPSNTTLFTYAVTVLFIVYRIKSKFIKSRKRI